MSGVPTSPIAESTAKHWLLNDRITSLREWGTHDERWLPADDDAVVTIGRDPPVSLSGHAAIRYDRPSVSRTHAVMQRRESYWQLYDHRSANGIFVNDEPATMQEVRPGDVIQLGDLKLIATSGRVRAMRKLWTRFLTTLDDPAALSKVDDALPAMRRFALPGGRLVLRGRVGARLALRVHELAQGSDRPFVALQHAERLRSTDELRALAMRAAHGTLFLRDGQLEADPQRELLHEIIDRKSAVRVIVAADRGRNCDHLGKCDVLDVPALAERSAEIETLVRELVRDAAIAMRAPTDLLRGGDWQTLARWDWTDHDDMEDNIQKLVALRHHGQPAPAARAVGVSVSWFCRWMLEHAIEK